MKPFAVKGFSGINVFCTTIVLRWLFAEMQRQCGVQLFAANVKLSQIYFAGTQNPINLLRLLTTKNIYMNKAELVAKLAEDAGITKTQANAAIDSFTEAVAKTLKKGDTVTLVGFGTFSVSKRSARTGRNPQTGAAIKIAAKKVAKFKAGVDLSKAVNK